MNTQGNLHWYKDIHKILGAQHGKDLLSYDSIMRILRGVSGEKQYQRTICLPAKTKNIIFIMFGDWEVIW